MANELFSTLEKERMDSKIERGEIVGIFKWKTRLCEFSTDRVMIFEMVTNLEINRLGNESKFHVEEPNRWYIC